MGGRNNQDRMDRNKKDHGRSWLSCSHVTLACPFHFRRLLWGALRASNRQLQGRHGMPRGFRFVAVFWLAAAARGTASAQAPADNSTGALFFEKRIRPLLAANCYQCHTPEKKRAGLVLDSVP